MASTAELSANARKLQEEEIERLVKCRIRSEIEARKAAEVTMKRAVQEAREIKKELMVMRQEKEELKQDTRKAAMAAATTPTPGGVVTKDELQKKLAQEKAKRKAQLTQLEALQHDVAQLRDQLEQQNGQLAKAHTLHNDTTRKLQDELQAKQREVEVLQDDTKKLKSAADEAKRKWQRAVKEKKEELQQLLDENAQLAKKAETLERLGDENAKLRKLLDKAKDKQGGVADEWQRRFDQREQAFLRQEHENKALLADKQREMEALEAEKRELAEQIEALESEAESREKTHAAEIERQDVRFQDLMASTKQLQERLQTLKDAGRAADKARLDAEARLAKAEELRDTAEAAADAVEARADKLEQQLGEARHHIELVEKALKKKGITIDFLLKTGSNSSSSSHNANKTPTAATIKPKAPKEPEDDSEADEPATQPTAVAKREVITTATTTTGGMTKDKSRATLEAKTRGPVVARTLLPTKAKPITSARDRGSSNNNHSHADREPTPERLRK